jgi:hypothetical protein
MGTLHELPDFARPDEADPSDWAFGAVLFVVWVCSVARVSAAVATREVFGVEASLAFVCTLALPWCALRAWLRHRARRQALQNRQRAALVAFRRRA